MATPMSSERRELRRVAFAHLVTSAAVSVLFFVSGCVAVPFALYIANSRGVAQRKAISNMRTWLFPHVVAGRSTNTQGPARNAAVVRSAHGCLGAPMFPFGYLLYWHFFSKYRVSMLVRATHVQAAAFLRRAHTMPKPTTLPTCRPVA